jgi:hypothetical protein
MLSLNGRNTDRTLICKLNKNWLLSFSTYFVIIDRFKRQYLTKRLTLRKTCLCFKNQVGLPRSFHLTLTRYT